MQELPQNLCLLLLLAQHLWFVMNKLVNMWPTLQDLVVVKVVDPPLQVLLLIYRPWFNNSPLQKLDHMELAWDL